MFRLVRDIIDRVVDQASGAAKVTVEVTTCLSTAAVAEPLKKVMDDSRIPNKMWDIQQKVAAKMCHLIDDAVPITKAIAKAPVRKAERLYEVGQGVSQVLFTDQKKEGYEKIENALTDMIAIVITGGMAGAAFEFFTETESFLDASGSASTADQFAAGSSPRPQ